MPSLRLIKSLNNANPNAVEINSAFGLPASLEVYRTDKTYNPGERVLYLDATTQTYSVYKCISSASGAFTPSLWKLDNVDQELNELHTIRDEIQADILRQMSPSGVLDYVAGATVSANSAASGKLPYGKMQFTNYSGFLMSNYKNFFATNPFTALVNGYKLNVTNVENNPGSASVWLPIQLNQPPVNGTREDFVFLEAWFEEIPITSTSVNNKRRTLKWRVRVVDDVDFTVAPKGFLYSDFINHNVTPQGGNTEPVPAAIANRGYSQFASYTLRNALTPRDATAVNDYSLHVAGRGSSTAQNLKTADGYVYGIPLFRVRRRNSGGYREDNLNGAEMFEASPTSNLSNTWDGSFTFNKGERANIDFTAPLPATFKVGKTISRVNGDIAIGTIVERVSDTRIVVEATTSLKATVNGQTFIVNSDRPDGKYANIIDKDDVIDMRNLVSLTGFDYDKLLRESFDKFLRGELTEGKATTKEQLGYYPAPPAKVPTLLDTTVVGNDGVTRKLTNLFGVKSNVMNSLKWVPNTGSPGAVATISYPAKDTLQIVKNDISGVMTTYSIYYALNPNAYYLLGADITHQQGSFSRLYVDGVSTAGVASASNTDINTTKRLYLKLGPANFVGRTRFNIHLYTSGTNATQAQLRKLAIYEVTEAEYNKILVDPGFDDAGLEKKYPYVDSYLDISTNIFNISTVKNGRPDGSLTSPSFVVADNTVTTAGTASSTSAFYTTLKVDQTREMVIDAVTNFPDLQVGVYTGTTTATELVAPTRLPLYFNTAGNPELTVVFYSQQSTAGVYFRDIVFSYAETYNGASPFGRWKTPVGIKERNFSARDLDILKTEQRRTWSDAASVDQVTEVISPLSTPQKHITVTQATPGTWAVNDTIKINVDGGVLTGAMDTDTARMVITTDIGNVVTGPVVLPVDIVDASVAVNDVFKIVKYDMTSISVYAYTVTAIDLVNKKITVQVPGNTRINAGDILVEYTTSSSVPTMSLLKNDGVTVVDATSQFTWSGLGTSEVTGTLTSIATDSNKASFTARYSAVYPAKKGIKFVPTSVTEVRVNGEKYVKSATASVSTIANFANKTSGVTSLNPHISRHRGSVALEAPTAYVAESTTFGYEYLQTLNGVSAPYPYSTANGTMSTNMFTFNIIEHIERTFGPIPAPDVLRKVAWLRANLNRITCYWYGFGTSPAGNKATVAVWSKTMNAWVTTGTTTATTPQKLSHFTTSIQTSTIFDNDGLVHYLAYADPSDGTTASVINTDYVELVIDIRADVAATLASGDTTQTDDLYDTFVPEKSDVVLSRNLLSTNQAFPVDTSNNLEFSTLGTGVMMEIPKPGEIRVYRPTGSDEFRFYLRNVPMEKNEWYTVTGELKVSKFPALATSINMTFKQGDSGGQTLQSKSLSFKKDEFVPFVVQLQNSPNSPSSTLDRLMFVFNSGTATTEEADITFRKLTVQKGYLENPLPHTSAPGRKRYYVSNYVNKIIGNVNSNPHRMLVHGSPLAANSISPLTANYTEAPQANYDSASVDNSATGLVRTPTSGNRAFVFFEYDFSHLGMSTANLRKVLEKFTFKWVGYGVGEGAGATASYGVELRSWNASSGAWYTSPTPELAGHTESTPKAIELPFTTSNSFITENQKLYFMVSTVAAGGSTVQSSMYTAYAKLTCEFAPMIDIVKSNVVKVRKETKELKLHFPKKSYLNGQDDVVEVVYDHLPVPTLFNGAERVTILAELDYVFASDLSSAVGHKQGVRHHYPNPLYRLNNDHAQVFGEFGFANIPLAADSRNVNVGSEVSVIDTGIRTNSTVQYAVPVIKKPMVFAFAYLVMHKSELKLLIINRYTSNGDVSQVANALNKVLLLSIDGRPYVKENDGVIRDSFYTSTAWKTPTGEIQGYLNDRGEIIPTYQ